MTIYRAYTQQPSSLILAKETYHATLRGACDRILADAPPAARSEVRRTLGRAIEGGGPDLTGIAATGPATRWYYGVESIQVDP